MRLRYAKGWVNGNPVAQAVYQLSPWYLFTCRAGDIWPGIKEPIPQGTPGAGDFAAICRKEAAALWAEFSSLTVMWSGGIDSNLLACLLVESCPAGASLTLSGPADRLAATDDQALNWLRDHGCATVVTDTEVLHQVVADGGMVVTGVHADTLLCGDLIRYNDLYAAIWDMSVEEMFVRCSGLAPGAVRGYLERLEPLLALMPLARTAANVAWWLDFTCAWDSDAMMAWRVFGLAPGGVGYRDFFAAPAFQLWSMQDVALKVGKTADTHKQLYTNLIAEIVGFMPNLPLRTEIDEEVKMERVWGEVIGIREDWSLIQL
ncbi:hypothetical protein [Pseudomonas anguilliseptica]|uniref:hypothetical protein n=1 Tax=Pseudomonas anguilliseptica TaxID=53406 RepID=UPI00325B34DD